MTWDDDDGADEGGREEGDVREPWETSHRTGIYGVQAVWYDGEVAGGVLDDSLGYPSFYDPESDRRITPLDCPALVLFVQLGRASGADDCHRQAHHDPRDERAAALVRRARAAGFEVLLWTPPRPFEPDECFFCKKELVKPATRDICSRCRAELSRRRRPGKWRE